MWVTVMQCSLPAFCRALSLRAAVPKALQANEAWKGRWGLDQGKIAWPSDRICLVTHSLFLIDAHQGWTRGRRLQCVYACARAYMSACNFIAMRFEIPVLIQDANSSDSIINIMYRDRTHTSTHTHTNTQIAAEPLETTIRMCLGNCFTLGEKIALFSFFQAQANTATHLPFLFQLMKVLFLLLFIFIFFFTRKLFPFVTAIGRLANYCRMKQKQGRRNRVSYCFWRSSTTISGLFLSTPRHPHPHPPPRRHPPQTQLSSDKIVIAIHH